MDKVIIVARTVLPVFIVLAAGVFLRRTGLVSREGVNTLKKVVVNITLPAVVFGAFAGASYSLLDVAMPLFVFAACVAGWAMGKLACKIFRIKDRYLPYLTTCFEAGMLGYAFFEMVRGGHSAEFARLHLGQVLFCFTVYKGLLAAETHGRADPKKLAKEMFLSPVMIAVVAGILVGATGLYRLLQPSGVSGILDSCVSFISAPTAVIILLAVGYDLKLSGVKWKRVCAAIGLRLVIMAALCAGMVFLTKAIWPQSEMATAIIMLFILPPPFVLPVFVDDPEPQPYFSSVLSFYTLLTVAGVAVMAAAA